MKQKLYVGITNNNELYCLEIEQPHDNHDYFAMSGSSYSVDSQERLEQEARDRLDDGEYWQMAVQDGRTELSKDDWNELVLNTDGWESMHDIVYNLSPIEHEGQEYYFLHSAGGQHEEHDFKHLFIPEQLRAQLMDIWKKYHLKKDPVELPELPKQNENEIAKQAIPLMLEDN